MASARTPSESRTNAQNESACGSAGRTRIRGVHDHQHGHEHHTILRARVRWRSGHGGFFGRPGGLIITMMRQRGGWPGRAPSTGSRHCERTRAGAGGSLHGCWALDRGARHRQPPRHRAQPADRRGRDPRGRLDHRHQHAVRLIALAEAALTGFTDEIFDIPHVTAAPELFIDIPGPETDRLAALARHYDTYIAVQCKARWPKVIDESLPLAGTQVTNLAQPLAAL